MSAEHKIKGGFFCAIILMLVTTALPFRAISTLKSMQVELIQAENRMQALTDTLLALKDAETSTRGFLITGQEDALEPYHAALAQLERVRTQLKASFVHSEKSRQVAELDTALALKTNEWATVIDFGRGNGVQLAQENALSEQARQQTVQIEKIAAALWNEADSRHHQIRQEINYFLERLAYTEMAAMFCNILLLGSALYFMFQLLNQQRATAEALRKSGADLNAGLQELAQRNSEISILAETARALGSAVSRAETYAISALYCAKLLPHTSGALFLFGNSRDFLESAAQWGTPSRLQTLKANECWALRRGQPHKSVGPADLSCLHYGDTEAKSKAHLCIPLTAQGQVLGVFTLEFGEGQETGGLVPSENDISLAIQMTEQISMALSSVTLRDEVMKQAITDPLTGLFNRRYMDEILQRELLISRRKSVSLSCIMLDIDHFKKVNDTFGHEAGDTVLRSLASHLKLSVRETDWAFRFGGEELVVILPDCSKRDAALGAEKIRQSISALVMRHNTQAIGQITASFGVATFPEDAGDAESLIDAADKAMYHAKKAGRNQVQAANQSLIPAIPATPEKTAARGALTEAG
jgi:diguanylate cyclase (GGDEF)-like protein